MPRKIRKENEMKKKKKKEVSDFILGLIDNENLPKDIRNKAGELWQKI